MPWTHWQNSYQIRKRFFHWNGFNWFIKSVWYHWPPNFTKENEYLGFSKNTITWFKSYLCERKFKISINTSYSIPANLLCGGPQGFISGSLFFLLEINHLPQAAVSDSLLCVDDVCTVFQHKSGIEIEKQLIRDFSSVCVWFVDNKLSIHFGQEKTKSVSSVTKHKTSKC